MIVVRMSAPVLTSVTTSNCGRASEPSTPPAFEHAGAECAPVAAARDHQQVDRALRAGLHAREEPVDQRAPLELAHRILAAARGEEFDGIALRALRRRSATRGAGENNQRNLLHRQRPLTGLMAALRASSVSTCSS